MEEQIIDIRTLQNPYSTPSSTREAQETQSLLQEINPASIVVELKHLLAGEEFDDTDNKWHKKYEELLNNEGINKVIGIMKGVVNTNTILSNLTDKEVNLLVWDVGVEITLLLVMKWEDYEVDKANLTTIVSLCCRTCFLALKRGMNHGEWDSINKTFRVGESVQQRMYPEGYGGSGGSLFGGLFKR